MTAPANSRISDERMDEIDTTIDRLRSFARAYPETAFPPTTDEEREWIKSERRGLLDRISADMGRHFAQFATEAADALTELRERRAQAVTPVAWRVEWPKEGLLEHFSNEKTARGMEAGGATVTPLYAAPPPAQAAGVTESKTHCHRAGGCIRAFEDDTCGEEGQCSIILDIDAALAATAPPPAAGVTEEMKKRALFAFQNSREYDLGLKLGQALEAVAPGIIAAPAPVFVVKLEHGPDDRCEFAFRDRAAFESFTSSVRGTGWAITDIHERDTYTAEGALEALSAQDREESE